MSTPLLVPERKRTPIARVAAGLRQIAEALEEMEGGPAVTPGRELDPEEMAAALKVSVAQVYRLVREGKIKAHRYGKRRGIRATVEEFEAYRRRALR